MRIKIFRKLFCKTGTADGTSQRIEFDFQIVDTQPLKKLINHVNHLRVNSWVGNAKNLGTNLVKLAITALLRALITIHGTYVIITRHRITLGTFILYIGPHDGRGAFGPQGQGLSLPINKGIHLLLNNTGRLPNGTDKKIEFFQDRGPHLFITVEGKQFSGMILDELPHMDLGREDIIHPTKGFNGHNNSPDGPFSASCY